MFTTTCSSATKNNLESCLRTKTESTEGSLENHANFHEKENKTESITEKPRRKQQREKTISTSGGQSDSGKASIRNFGLNSLNITFSQSGLFKTQNPRTSKKFSHQSPQAVLLYSLLYNHFKLESVKDQLPSISSIDHKFITTLQVILRDWKLMPDLSSTQPTFSSHSLLSLLQNQDKTTQQKLATLKAIIEQMSCELAQEIFSTLIERLKSGKKEERRQKLLESTVSLDSGVSGEEAMMNQFGWLFGVTIKLYKSGGKQTIGAFKSCITLGLKDEGEHIYSFKNISCFESEN